MTLSWRRHIDYFGSRGLIEVYWEEHPEGWSEPDPKPTIADCGYRVVAKLLAEPLRRAFDGHLDEHGCAERHGFGYCEEAMRLFELLPVGDRMIVA